jgi:2-octaprenylphenol hydroxylase
VTAASDGVLGELELQGERAGFPLRRLEAPRYALERCVLVGDAAHIVHPLAGQGVNLGFLDAAALAQVLAGARDEREDPGALRLLRRYERWRKGDNQLVSTAIDGFNRFLSFGRDRVGRAAQRGLGWVDGSAIAKRLLIERAMGLAGEMPEVARRRSPAPDGALAALGQAD